VSFLRAIRQQVAGLGRADATISLPGDASSEADPVPALLFASFVVAIGLIGAISAQYAGASTALGASVIGGAVAFAAFALYRGRSQRLAQSADQSPYDALTAAVGDLVMRHDSAGTVLSASGGALALGLDPTLLIGRGFFDRVHVSDRPSLLQAMHDAIRGDETISIVLRLRKGGQIDRDREFEAPSFASTNMRLRRLAAASHPQDDATATVVSVVTVAASAADAERSPETMIGEPGIGDSSKDRLLANVSHELRTPLNAILGFSEILGDAELAPRDPLKQREYARIIHASADHLLSVVNMILDMSKIEARRFAIAPESFEIEPLIHACCDMLRLKAEQGGVELVLTPLHSSTMLIADKRACRQIVINLLSNAVKFTRSGGRVTIDASVESGWLALHVDDTGIGIAPGHFARLGDPFFQVRSSYDRMFEGTGLGLSLVRGLVGLHGGTLSLESAIEMGTRVTVRLPLDCRGRAPSDAAPARIETIASAPKAPHAAGPLQSSSISSDATKEKKIA
jgi:cell cycle sensor histidine kinase DivJ